MSSVFAKAMSCCILAGLVVLTYFLAANQTGLLWGPPRPDALWTEFFSNETALPLCTTSAPGKLCLPAGLHRSYSTLFALAGQPITDVSFLNYPVWTSPRFGPFEPMN